MLAMDVNDDAGNLMRCGALTTIASKLGPYRLCVALKNTPHETPPQRLNNSSCSCPPRKSCSRTPIPNNRTGLSPRAKAWLSNCR